MNGVCFHCSYHLGVIVFRENVIDFYDEIDCSLTKYEIWKLEKAERLDFEHFDYVKNWRIPLAEMTAKEQKFATFFNGEKVLVKDMDDLRLKAHIEELQDIAFEARARLSAADDEARERGAKTRAKKGFQTSVASDDFTSNAIHNINERQKKMSKTEKEIERLVDMGMNRKDAENLYKTKTIIAVKEHGAGSVEVDKLVNATPGGTKSYSNPFAKNVEDLKPSAELEAVLGSILNPVIVEAKPLSNPFASASASAPIEIENLPVIEETQPPPVIPPIEVEGLAKDLPLEPVAEVKTVFNPFAKKG